MNFGIYLFVKVFIGFLLRFGKILVHLHDPKKTVRFFQGEMAEWSIAAVLKTVELQGSGGSNPSLSAQASTNRFYDIAPGIRLALSKCRAFDFPPSFQTERNKTYEKGEKSGFTFLFLPDKT